MWIADGTDGSKDGRFMGRRVKLLTESGNEVAEGVLCRFAGRGLVIAQSKTRTEKDLKKS